MWQHQGARTGQPVTCGARSPGCCLLATYTLDGLQQGDRLPRAGAKHDGDASQSDFGTPRVALEETEDTPTKGGKTRGPTFAKCRRH